LKKQLKTLSVRNKTEYRKLWVSLWMEWLMKGYQNKCYNVNQKDAWTEENLGKMV
jgi:hypothetical protein